MQRIVLASTAVLDVGLHGMESFLEVQSPWGGLSGSLRHSLRVDIFYECVAGNIGYAGAAGGSQPSCSHFGL